MQIKAKKSLGQHFLHSKKVLNDIILTAKITEDERILEIGPGTGILTQELLNAKARVIAIEKDIRSYELLKEKFANERSNGKLILKYDDILRFDCTTLDLKNGEYTLVANIPYYITGAILEKFLANDPRPNRIIILTQKEVAERIIARNKKESILSISVKAFGDPRIIAKVPKGAFVPPPKVDSAILAIDNIGNNKFTENKLEISHFFNIVRAGFAHKRKLLIRNLESIASPEKIKNIWNILSLDEKTRAEDLTLEQWIALSTKFNT
jgi:16S rRNA (adenine1518-N6/adenine1519-N6)-dimethyltransferase